MTGSASGREAVGKFPALVFPGIAWPYDLFPFFPLLLDMHSFWSNACKTPRLCVSVEIFSSSCHIHFLFKIVEYQCSAVTKGHVKGV